MRSLSAKNDCEMVTCKMVLSRFASAAVVATIVVMTIAFPHTLQGQTSGNDTHLYFFTSQGCAPCEVVKPAIAKLDAAGYPVTTVDIRHRTDWATHFRVSSTPTVIMVRNRQIIGRHAGVVQHSELLQWFTTSGFTLSSREPTAASLAGAAVSTTPSPQTNAQPIGTKVVISEPDSTNPVASIGSKSDFSGAAGNQPDAGFRSPTMHRGTAQPANSAERLALQATVKIRVEDEEGISYATGTVVHAHGNECLVVTCGHVFRDSQGTGDVSCEYGFANQQTSVADGDLIFYDADARDIGLLVMTTDDNVDEIRPVEVASRRATIRKGVSAFSIGCDHGEAPTIRHTQIKNRAVYDGAIKYDIYGRPVDGRSGGGLFTDDGQFIGVCNAAVVDVDEGIYAALDSIHWQFEHTNLAHLFGPSTTQPDAFSLAAVERPSPPVALSPPAASPRIASPRIASPSLAAVVPKPPTRSVEFPRSTPRLPSRSSLVSLKGEGASSGNSVDSDREVLIIVRSKNDSGLARTIVLPNPSHRLIDYLENMPPVKSEVRQLDVANHREARVASEQFRQRIQNR